jgi:hypothetical protein
MDAQEQMVMDSEISVGVLGKGADFVLIPIEDGPIDEAATEDALSKGYVYCGVMGVKNGQPGVKCEPNPDAVFTMMHAALAFAQQVAEMLRPKGDELEFLERLYRLQDGREN